MFIDKLKNFIHKFRYSDHSRKYLVLLALVCFIIVISIAIGGCDKEPTDTVDVTENTNTEVKEPPAMPKEYNLPPVEEENDLLKISTSAIGTDKKICYLTFDDGPTREVTPAVLDVLKEYKVKATFFTLGKMLDSNRDIAERVFDEGHLIANHSYSHDYDSLYETSSSFMEEINKSQAIINEISGGESFKLIRFPGGSHNAGSYAAQKQEYKEVLKQNGYYFVDWNCLNGDAEAALRSTDELINRVKQTAVGKNLVVLMHDAATKTTTPEALGSIIEYLRAEGYEFKRLDEVEYYNTGKAEQDQNSLIL